MTNVPTACCRDDNEPLVLTFERRGYEFVCVVCGRYYTYFEPKPLPSTAARSRRLEVLKARRREEPSNEPRRERPVSTEGEIRWSD